MSSDTTALSEKIEGLSVAVHALPKGDGGEKGGLTADTHRADGKERANVSQKARIV